MGILAVEVEKGNTEQIKEVVLNPSQLDRKVPIGRKLTSDMRIGLTKFLKAHQKCFAWSIDDMPRINLSIITHELGVDSTHKHVKHKRKRFVHKRNKIMNEKVEKLEKMI